MKVCQVYIVTILFLLIAGFILNREALAQFDLTMEVKAGFDGYVKVGRWIPVTVILTNKGKEIEGILDIQFEEPSSGLIKKYQKPVILPTNSRKKEVIYLRRQSYANELEVNLLSGRKRIIEVKTQLRQLPETDIVILCISDNKSLLSFLSGTNSPLNTTGKINIVYLWSEQSPEHWKGFDSIDMIVLNRPFLSLLSYQQKIALKDWVEAGGDLVISAGADVQEFNNTALDALLPVKNLKTVTVSDLPSLVNRYQNPLKVEEPFLVLTSDVEKGEVLIQEGDIPLMVKAPAGLGCVYFLAFDIGRYPIRGWPGNHLLWSEIITDLKPSFLPLNGLPSYYGHMSYRDYGWGDITSVLRDIPSMRMPSFRFIGIFLVIYIIILGPLNFLLLKRCKIEIYYLVTTPVLALLFTLGTYMLGYRLKGGDIILSRVSVLNVPNQGRTALLDNYFGLFSPNRTAYDIIFMNDSAVSDEIFASRDRGQSSEPVKRILQTVQADKMQLSNVVMNMWSMRTFQSESIISIPGGIEGEVYVQDGRVKGAIINNTSYHLKDTYLVLGSRPFGLGNLKPGQKRNLAEGLPSSVNETGQLAAQIAGGHWPVKPLQLGETEKEMMTRRRQGAVHYVLSSPEECQGDDRPFLLGWIEQDLLEVKISPRPDKNKGLSVLKACIPLSFKGGTIEIPEGIVKGKITEQSGCSFAYPGLWLYNGYYVTEFNLPFPRDTVADKLSISVEYDRVGSAPVFSVYNWQSRDWDKIDLSSTWTDIPYPDRYLSAWGKVRAKLESKKGRTNIHFLDIKFQGHR